MQNVLSAVSRRRRHRRGRRPVLAAVVVAAVALTAAACGSDDTVSSDPSAASGVLSWSIPPLSTWDPVASNSGIDVTPLSLAYASLTRLAPDGDAGPGLASVEVLP
ncbi:MULTISPECIES: hypothetical protein [unclassified Frankia]|uniref:hypothetical protein n=1 Tax=unclassified Frankia TaxID=2632575 RepID=UPI0020251E16